MEICREQETVSKNPCDRACKARCRIAEHRNKHKSDQGTRRHLKDACQNCKLAVSHTLNQKAYNIHESQRNVEGTVAYQKQPYICNDLRLCTSTKNMAS